MALNRRMPILICYDIADPRRLQRLHRQLAKRALMVQYSVYYCELTREGMERIKAMIANHIDPTADDVRLYPLPGDFDITLLGEPASGCLPVLKQHDRISGMDCCHAE